MRLTCVQVEKAKKVLAKNMKDANKKFRESNTDYADIELDKEDVQIISGFAVLDAGRSVSPETFQALAGIRKDFVLADRDTATLDILSVKTEENIPESSKFKMTPYLAAKRYTVGGKVWKQGYQDPAACDDAPLNRFIGAGADIFMVLRAKGLFQLMSDAEIDDFVGDYGINEEDYFQLCL